MQVSFESLCTSVCKRLKDTKVQGLAVEFDDQQWGTSDWAQTGADLRQDIAAKMRATALKAVHLHHGVGPLVLASFLSVICANCPGYRLQRFTTLWPALRDSLETCIRHMFDEAAPTISVMTNEAIGKLYAGKGSSTQSDSASDTLNALDQAVDGCILSYIVPALKLRNLKLPPNFQLEEDGKVQQTREMLNKQLSALADAYHTISDIEQAFHDVRRQHPVVAVPALLPRQSIQTGVELQRLRSLALTSTGSMSHITSSDWQLESFYSIGSANIASADIADQGGVDQQDWQPEALGSQDMGDHTTHHEEQGQADSEEHAHGTQLEGGDVGWHPEVQSNHADAARRAGAEGCSVAQIEAHPFDDVPISPISSISDSFVHVEW